MIFLAEEELLKCIGFLIEASKERVQKLEQYYAENE